MGSSWIAVLCVLLGIMVALNLGTYDIASEYSEYEAVQNASQEYYRNITSETSKEQGEDIIQAWLSPLLIGAATVGILTYFVPSASVFAIPAAVIATTVSYFIQPINALQALGLPWYIIDSVLVILSLMFIIAMIDFIRG